MKVDSSMMKEIEYKDGNLYVLFNSDEAYVYKGVPTGIYEKLMSAKSKGQFFDTFVKKAGYEYEKIQWLTRNFHSYQKLIDEMKNNGTLVSEQDEYGNERIRFTGEMAGSQAAAFKEKVKEIKKKPVAETVEQATSHIEARLKNFKEDRPGQKREIIVAAAVRFAVEVADRVIMQISDGTVEETNYLTSQVALKFVEKVNYATSHQMLKKQLLERVK